jgi:hypothetical protein
MHWFIVPQVMLSSDQTVNEGIFSELCIGRDVEGSNHLKQDIKISQKNCKKPGKVSVSVPTIRV